MDIGFAVLVSFIIRELDDEAVLHTTAYVIALFVESQSANLSVLDLINLSCIIRRVLFLLGGSIFAG